MSEFRSKRFRFLTVCVLGMMLLTVVAESSAALSDTYTDYAKSSDKRSKEEWISRFERDLTTSDASDPAFYHSMNALGDLYKSVYDHDASIQVHTSLLEDTKAPALIRVDAGIKATELIEQTNGKPALLFEMSDQVREVFNTSDLGYSRDAFVIPIKMLHLKSARWLCIAGKEEADELIQKSHTAEANSRFISAMKKADIIMNEYISEWSSLPTVSQNRLATLNGAPDFAMYLQGEIAEAISGLYTKQGNSALAAATRQKGEQILNDLLQQYPKNVIYSQPAAVLLIRMKRAAGTSDTDIVPYISDLLPKLASGHAVLNYLSDLSMEVCRTHGEEMSANMLFQLVLEQEKVWFPEEYSRHINYQVCLIESTMNLINMDMLSEAADNIQKLSELGITDSNLLNRLQHVEETYIRAFAGATETDTEELYAPTMSDETTNFKEGEDAITASGKTVSHKQPKMTTEDNHLDTEIEARSDEAAMAEDQVINIEQNSWSRLRMIVILCFFVGLLGWIVIRKRMV